MDKPSHKNMQGGGEEFLNKKPLVLPVCLPDNRNIEQNIIFWRL